MPSNNHQHRAHTHTLCMIHTSMKLLKTRKRSVKLQASRGVSWNTNLVAPRTTHKEPCSLEFSTCFKSCAGLQARLLMTLPGSLRFLFVVLWAPQQCLGACPIHQQTTLVSTQHQTMGRGSATSCQQHHMTSFLFAAECCSIVAQHDNIMLSHMTSP